MRSRKFLASFALLGAVIVFSLPAVRTAFAEITYNPASIAASPGLPFWGSPLVSCTGNYYASSTLEDPTKPTYFPSCTSFCDILHTTQNLIYFAITVTLFVLAPIMFVGGGIVLMFAGGSPELSGKGRSMMLYAVIGVLIVLCAFVVINTFLWVLGNGSGAIKVSWPDISCNVQPQTTRFDVNGKLGVGPHPLPPEQVFGVVAVQDLGQYKYNVKADCDAAIAEQYKGNVDFAGKPPFCAERNEGWVIVVKVVKGATCYADKAACMKKRDEYAALAAQQDDPDAETDHVCQEISNQSVCPNIVK